MSIENELADFLNASLKEQLTKSRDIELIHYYYGFRGEVWPTLEKTAQRFGVGSKERVRQILNSKFRERVKVKDLPSVSGLTGLITSRRIVRSDKMSEAVSHASLVQSEVPLRGLLNLLHDLGLCIDYELYTAGLLSVPRGTFFSSRNSFLINQEELPRLKKALHVAKGLPGWDGIARLNFLKTALGEEFEYFDEVVDVLRSDEDSWFFEYEGVTYYLFETRDNTLINAMEKVKCVADKVDLNELAETLSNALHRRAPKFDFPPPAVVRSYLSTSKHTTLAGPAVDLNLSCSGLMPIELDIVATLKKDQPTDFTSLSGELKQKEYTKAYIIKSVSTSPLVYVDKSGGRGHYKYSLVGRSLAGGEGARVRDRYDRYRERLIDSSKEGTDREQLGYARNEHPILRQWLFDGKSVERCAICREEYSVSSLIAAHKKRRADCSGNERIDPYIVMPLCLFGCDHLYERGYIYIHDGRVAEGMLPAFLTGAERTAVSQVLGRNLDQRWLMGSDSYFRKPERLGEQITV